MMFADIWWQLLLLGVSAYFVGNLNWSIIICRLNKRDVRKMGSGNPGTMNMLRNMGAGWGLLTLILDILKGVVPTLIGKLVFSALYPDMAGFNCGDLAEYIAGFAVVLGHVYPVTMKFKGGKGVASTFGVFFVTEPILMAIALVVCIGFICIFEYGSVGSFIGIVIPVVGSGIALSSTYFVDGALTVALAPYLATCLLLFGITFLIFFAHRKNICQILAGTEHKTQLVPIIKKFCSRKKGHE